MCRFALYLGSELTVSRLVTEPSNSIIHQSFHNLERTEPLNGDGFGLAWYVPEMTEYCCRLPCRCGRSRRRCTNRPTTRGPERTR